MWLLKILLCFLISSAIYAEKKEILFKIPQGELKGLTTTTIYHNVTYFSFKGIPYSKPKIGINKFNPPETPDSWNGTWDATKFRDECIQIDPFLKRIKGSEDCLYVNVYTPTLNTDKCHAVMVWIHGGAWIFGSGNDNIYGPDFLIERDVLIVTMNYRLGPIGFLNTGDANAPGNVGMKDQSYALRWVRNNIQYFGGCPNKITIFGESSGSASVHYHRISPMSKGYFDRAIQQSGSATDEWAYNYNPRKDAFSLGEELGISTSDSKILVDTMKAMNSTDILRANQRMTAPKGFTIETLLTWLPSVEPHVDSVEMFLPDNPMNLIIAGQIVDIPVIAGVNLDECALFLPDVLKHVERNRSYIMQEMHTLLPNNLNITDIDESKRVAKEIYAFYFGDREITEETKEELLALLTDAAFFIQFHITTLVAGEHIKSNIYKYLFSYRTHTGLISKYKNLGNVSSHADDLEYIWYSQFFRNKPRPGTPAELFVHLFTKLWSNFAKDGDPTSVQDKVVNFTWKAMGKENNILNINLKSEMQVGFFPERMNFWVKMYNKVLGEFKELLTIYKTPSSAEMINLSSVVIVSYIFVIFSLR